MQRYRLGDQGPAVAEIRAKLRSLGLLRSGASDGVVGPETYRALDEARWQLGDRVLFHQINRPLVGDDVVALQSWLSDRGFDVGRCDGIFGSRTEAAVRE